MTKSFVLVVAMGVATADAQPAPPPTDKPATGEKAGTDESLEQGGDVRPWAAGVAQGEQKAALVLFREGNVELNSGLFAKAGDKYRSALEHWKHPAIFYNLALAQMNLDQIIEAYDDLQQAVRFGEAPLQSKDKFDHAKDYLLLLEKQLAEVEVSCDKAGAKVAVDGKEAFVAPGRFHTRVRIGKHTFVAEKRGYTTRINAPFIGPGEKFRIELKLYTAEELTRYERRWKTTWVPYAVIGGGAAIIAIGGLLELSASSSFSDYDRKVAQCSVANSGCAASAELTSLEDSGESKRTLGYVGYSVGLGAVAVGIGLAILNRPHAYQVRPEDLQEGVSVGPLVVPGGGGGAAVQGRF